MNKLNFTFFKTTLLCLLCLLLTAKTEAQYARADTATNSYGTFILSNVYNGHVSDYFYYLIMSNVVTGDSCSQDMDFDIGGCYTPCSNDDEYINYDHNTAFPFDTVLIMPQQAPDSTINVYISGFAYGQPACTGGIVSTTFYVNNANTSSGPPLTASTPYLIGPQLNSSTTLRAGSSSIYQPVLTWTKMSDVPDSVLTYVVYRSQNATGIGAIAIDTVRGTNVVYGGTHSYEDNALLQRGDYSYYIEVFISRQHTREVAFSGTTTLTLTNDIMDATHGTIVGQTELTWLNMAATSPNGIAILRNGQQLSVVNRSATTYSDFYGIPGVKYYYTVAPLDSNFNSPLTYSDSGSSKPNGELSGYVRSLYGSGVPHVAVTATATVDGQTYSYSDSTDATGYYTINNIYYDSTATYIVTASRGSDQFSPSAISRNLNIQNNNITLPDIEDTTVFTIQGNVNFATYPGQTCTIPVAGAQLYVNGQNSNIVTDASGHYRYTANTIGTYTVAFKYYNHTFNVDSQTVYVDDNSNSSVDFTDTKVDTLVLDLTSGCGSQICDSAEFLIQSTNGCLSIYKHFDGLNKDTLVLPATQYSINLPNSVYTTQNGQINYIVSTDGPYGQLNAINVDLTSRDTIYISGVDTTYTYDTATYRVLPDSTIIYTPADTIMNIDSFSRATTPFYAATFVYHGPLSISVQNLPSLCNRPGEYLVNQNQLYYLQIRLLELSIYRGDTVSCYRDTGAIQIYDNVSGAGVINAELTNGVYTYLLIPGQPNVPDNSTLHQYELLFNVYASVNNQAPANFDAWTLVQGIHTLTPTFNTTPQLPLMVLHDPPGSASYSSLEKDSSVAFNTQVLINTTFAAGGQAQVMVGKVIPVPATGATLPGPYGNLQLSGTDGYSRDKNTSLTMTFTASEVISTSPNAPYIGYEGDVFIGAAMNMKYSKAYELTVDSVCGPHEDTVIAYGIDSVSTEFVYSVYDLQHTILPNLYSLLQSAPASPDSLYNKAYFQTQINVWNAALSSDSATIASFTPTQNISFTAGASYDYTAVSDSNYQYTNNWALTSSFNQSFVVGFSDGNNINVNAGDNVSLNTTNAKDTNGTLDITTTYEYHLEDDVTGNYYSVNVGRDKHFGSPIFSTFAGASACPWEPGTQPRDEPTMTIDPLEIDNVPPTATAAFTVYLGNQSESQERRTYIASVSPETNPNGATIMIGGQDITQFPASFTIGYADVLPVVLTVQKGPFAADYIDLGINFGSACDSNINVLVPITVKFQNNCSDVSIIQPADGWLVNSSNNDTLNIAIAGYDQSNPNLQEIGIQYRLVNSVGNYSNWNTIPSTVIDSASIQPVYTNVIFDVASIPDGNYQIQAYARCGSGINTVYTYSPALSGVIDRSGFTLYGTPQPSNGILNLGENIGLQFNEDIDCNQTYERMQVTLTRDDNGANVTDSFSCYGNGLIITTFPSSFLDDSLDGVTLTASVSKVHDINGNGLSAPIVWSFLVNTSKIYWSPDNVNVTAVVGTGPTISGTMFNVGANNDSFYIVKLPTWLTVSQTGPYPLLGGTPQVPYQYPLSFTVSSSLNEGHYTDTVIALADGKRLYFFVTLDVVTQSPSWSVDPNNFQYNMNITANYSTTQLNTPLSSDTRDIIAAFVGNQCRGLGNIAYDPISNKYAAYITAYSNSTTGDTFTFRMWDALPGIEYQAVERLPFIADGSIGQPAAPYILHPAGEFQTIDLAPGWNWFSLNVAATDMSPKNVLSSITGNNGAVVKTQSIYDQFTTAATGWAGTLTAFSTNTSYMIHLDHADTIHFLGQPITDTSIIQIASGWNWVGFPRTKIATASSYLSNTNPSNGDILKSETQFTEYNAGNWAGSMNYMYPGQGYKLRSTNAYNFVIPPDRSLPSWNVDQNQFEQNMTVTADLQFNGTSTTQSNFLVGAFADSICIGTAQPEFIASENLYRVFITIVGDTANAYQPITFKVYDTDNDIEYTPTYMPVSVVPDTIIAKVEAPYIINVQTTTGINALNYPDGFGLLQNVPNPFSKTTSIEYTIPSEQQVTLSLYDDAGRLIRELVNGIQTAGSHTVSFEQDDLQAGVYLYQMRSGDFVKTRRMLIIR